MKNPPENALIFAFGCPIYYHIRGEKGPVAPLLSHRNGVKFVQIRRKTGKQNQPRRYKKTPENLDFPGFLSLFGLKNPLC